MALFWERLLKAATAALLFATLSACGGSDEAGVQSEGSRASVTTTSAAKAAQESEVPAGAVSMEMYDSTWQGPDGAPAERGSGPDRTFEVHTIIGSSHCGWESVVFLSVGWPLGSSPETSDQSRQYIRDEDGDLSGSAQLLSTFDPDVDLPKDARFSGYENEAVELWFGADNGDEAAYLKLDERVERWPRDVQHVVCG